MDYNSNLHIIQTIATIQGEGNFIGVPSVLIRLAGCNCRCTWCDTPWSWTDTDARVITEDDIDVYIEDILKTADMTARNLMITGGEPLLYINNPLFRRLLTLPQFETIEIETNGSLLTEEFLYNLPINVKLNISPKLVTAWYISDYNVTHENIHAVRDQLIDHGNFILKFVDDVDHKESMETFIEDINIDVSKIYMMPLTPNRKRLAPDVFNTMLRTASLRTLSYCMKTGYNFVPRLHLYLFDDEDEVI